MEDTRIYLITFKETDRKSVYFNSILVSHGVGNNSLSSITLPCEPLISFNPIWDNDAGEWYVVNQVRR